MLISKTPFRVSFFGGGTDFPEYFNYKKSRVIGSSINKYIYFFQSKFYSNLFDHKLRLFYKKNEFVNNLAEINHKVFRKALIKNKINENIEIHVASELPGFVGLGTSSSFTVGLLNLLNFYKKKSILSKKELSKKSIFFERKILNENVGFQDQILASYGGLNSISFYKNKFEIKKIYPKFSLKKLNKNLFLIYTGIQRTASHIESKKIKNLKNNISYLDQINEISNEAYKLFNKSKSPDFIGELLHETWMLKKKLHKKVTNQTIEQIYNKALSSGADGGKLLGAGAGGFVLFYVRDDNINKFKAAFDKKNVINFSFSEQGSEILTIK